MKRFLSIILVVGLTMGVISSLSMNTNAKDKNFIEVTSFQVSDTKDFNEKLLMNADKAVGGEITSTKSSEVTDCYFKFTLPKSAIVFLNYSMTSDADNTFLGSQVTAYANQAMSVVAVPSVTLHDTKTIIKKAYLPAGTYYISFKGKLYANGYTSLNTVGLAVGYIPVEKYSEGFSYSLSSTTKTTDDVVIKVNTADPDAEVFALEGVQALYLIDNDTRWTSETKLEGNEYIVSKNGSYTIRIKDSMGQYTQKVVNISNIDRSRPSSPVATNYKSGSKQIVGKAQAGMLVTANVAGKSYSAVVRDNGIFTISTPALVKNAKITLQAQSTTGLKSDVKTFSVK